MIKDNGVPDRGHLNLLNDLNELMVEARGYQFHDFKNTDYAAPKTALYERLKELAISVHAGRYDNNSKSA